MGHAERQQVRSSSKQRFDILPGIGATASIVIERRTIAEWVLAPLFRMMRGLTMRAIYQNEVAECGYACLAMVLSHFGRATEVRELQAFRPISANGLTC